MTTPQLIKSIKEVLEIVKDDNRSHAPSPQRSARVSALQVLLDRLNRDWEKEENGELF